MPGASLRPHLAFNPRLRRLSTPADAFQLHPDFALYGTTLQMLAPRAGERVGRDAAARVRAVRSRARRRRRDGRTKETRGGGGGRRRGEEETASRAARPGGAGVSLGDESHSEARIILRSPIHMSSCTRTCTRVHVAKIVSVATGTPCTVLKSEKKVNGHGLFFCCALRASQNFWPIRGEIGVKPHSDQLIGVG